MQQYFDTLGTTIPIEILGVNERGHEAGNPAICDGRTIPWLQDVEAANVWASWGVTFRDVWILDAENVVAHVYNLTENDLAVPANYTALRDLTLGVAIAGGPTAVRRDFSALRRPVPPPLERD